MKLKDYRQLAGLSREKLGELIGITGLQVWRIETGRCFPKASTSRSIYAVTNGAVTVADHSEAFEAHYRALAEKKAAKAALEAGAV